MSGIEEMIDRAIEDNTVSGDAMRLKPDWDKLPRLLYDMCEGPHAGAGLTLYAFDKGDIRLWYCQSCWLDAWRRERVQEVADRQSSGGVQGGC